MQSPACSAAERADLEDEGAVHELSRWLNEWNCQEALLDLSVKWPGASIPRRLIDITVRDPEAGTYQPEAQCRPETAAARTFKKKNARYPSTIRANVETITSEPVGRLGKEGVHVIEAMAADVAMMRGVRTTAPAAGRRMRHALGYSAHWSG